MYLQVTFLVMQLSLSALASIQQLLQLIQVQFVVEVRSLRTASPLCCEEVDGKTKCEFVLEHFLKRVVQLLCVRFLTLRSVA